MLIKSILGGISIAIASYIYLTVGGILGAFLFSIGLLLILNMQFKLFTGTVGFIRNKKDIQNNIIILIGNIIGAFAILLFPGVSTGIVAAKLLAPLWQVMFRGVICGIFIYSAVSCFRKEKDYMVPICVAGFILCGAEHCIADLCYVIITHTITCEALIFLAIVALGNILGALLIDKIQDL